MKKRIGLVLALASVLALGFLVSSCGRATVTAVAGTITGTIYAADGVSPVAGCTVYLKTDSSKSATTNAKGVFTLEGDWIVAGTYTLVASKGSYTLEFAVTITSTDTPTNVGSKEVDPTEGATIPDIGVVLTTKEVYYKYDYIERIITGLGYKYTTIEVTDINNNYNFISTFEVIFINCGTSGNGLTSSGEANLKKFVETAGNSLYVSDWAGDYIQAVWPTAINWYGGSVSAAQVGIAGTYEATAVDSALKILLGKTTAEVFYDLGIWVIISSEGTGTTVLLKGSPEVSSVYSIGQASSVERKRAGSSAWTVAGTLSNVPLAVRFEPGGSSKGTVIYTTFHNEAQASDVTDDMQKILKDFILSL